MIFLIILGWFLVGFIGGMLALSVMESRATDLTDSEGFVIVITCVLFAPVMCVLGLGVALVKSRYLPRQLWRFAKWFGFNARSVFRRVVPPKPEAIVVPRAVVVPPAVVKIREAGAHKIINQQG